MRKFTGLLGIFLVALSAAALTQIHRTGETQRPFQSDPAVAEEALPYRDAMVYQQETVAEPEPTATPEPVPTPVPTPVVATYSAETVGAASAVAAGIFQDLPLPAMSMTEAKWALAQAGWPEEEWPNILAIGACESSGGVVDANGEPMFHPGETGDSGNSIGWLQLNKGWWNRWPERGHRIELWMNPVENASVALDIWHARGRYGGAGGWSCADRLGIP